MNFDRFIEVAKKMKESSGDFKRYFHVTFVLSKKKILSVGVNSKKTHACSLNYAYRGSVGTHSELAALNQIKFRDIQNITIINIRLNAKNEVKLSKPCPGCSQLLGDFNVKKVYFSTNDGDFEVLGQGEIQ